MKSLFTSEFFYYGTKKAALGRHIMPLKSSVLFQHLQRLAKFKNIRSKIVIRLLRLNNSLHGAVWGRGRARVGDAKVSYSFRTVLQAVITSRASPMLRAPGRHGVTPVRGHSEVGIPAHSQEAGVARAKADVDGKAGLDLTGKRYSASSRHKRNMDNERLTRNDTLATAQQLPRLAACWHCPDIPHVISWLSPSCGGPNFLLLFPHCQSPFSPASLTNQMLASPDAKAPRSRGQ